MTGGAGADIFVMAADGVKDDIRDFADGEDLIDVSAWGITEFGMLDISQDNNNVRVLYGDELIEVKNALVAYFADDDFIFA